MAFALTSNPKRRGLPLFPSATARAVGHVDEDAPAPGTRTRNRGRLARSPRHPEKTETRRFSLDAIDNIRDKIKNHFFSL